MFRIESVSENQIIALAGSFQACKLIDLISRGEAISEESLQATIESIIIFDPDSIEDVYGSYKNLKIGFQTLVEEFDSKIPNRELSIIHYFNNFLRAVKVIQKHEKSLNALKSGLEKMQDKNRYLPLLEVQMLRGFAELYDEIILPLKLPVQIAANKKVLSNEFSQYKIKSLGLAGVRGVFMWRQFGGRQLSTFLQRKKIVAFAQSRLNETLDSSYNQNVD